MLTRSCDILYVREEIFLCPVKEGTSGGDMLLPKLWIRLLLSWTSASGVCLSLCACVVMSSRRICLLLAEKQDCSQRGYFRWNSLWINLLVFSTNTPPFFQPILVQWQGSSLGAIWLHNWKSGCSSLCDQRLQRDSVRLQPCYLALGNQWGFFVEDKWNAIYQQMNWKILPASSQFPDFLTLLGSSI